MLLNLLMLQVVTVFIVDVSGIMDELRMIVFRLVTGKGVPYDEGFTIRPFDCSLCMCFWVTLLYVTVESGFGVRAMFLAVMSALTSSLTCELIWAFRDNIIKLIRHINK